MSDKDKGLKTSHKGKVVKMPIRAMTTSAKKSVTTKAKKSKGGKPMATPKTEETKPQKTDFISQTLLQNPMEKTMKNNTIAFDQITKDASDITRDYSDAMMKSSTILMKGYESMISTVMGMVQSSAEKQARLMKEAMSSKTINEFAEIQNKIAQTGFDDFMSSATKISEMSVKVMTESSEPVNKQMTKAIQKASQSMAA